MASPNDGIKKTDAIVAGMLREKNRGSEAEGVENLTGILGRIDNFFAEATSAPAARSIEVAEDGDEATGDLDREIHLNLLLGVLQATEAQPPTKAGFSKDGVILPGKEAEKRLQAEKMRDSKTLLAMLNSLGNTSDDTPVGQPVEVNAEQGSDDEGCMIFDAEDFSSDSSSDGGRLITRQPVANKGKRMVEEM